MAAFWNGLLIWVTAWRHYVMAVVGVSLWAAVFGIYFWTDVRRYRRARRPHRWEVDLGSGLVTKAGPGEKKTF